MKSTRTIQPVTGHKRHEIQHTATVLFALTLLTLFLLSAISVNALARPRLVVSGFAIADGGSATVGSDFDLLVNITDIDPVCAMTTTTSIVTNAPFVARGTNTAMPVDICGGETKTVRLPLHVDATAIGGSYQLPLTLSFEDTLNTPYSSSSILTIAVSGTPDIRAHITNSNPIDVTAGDTATLSIAFENAGTYDAQSVNATLVAGGNSPVEVKWTKAFATLGTIKPRATVTSEFGIELPKTATADLYPLTLHVEYLDENRAVVTKDLALTLTPKKKALFSAALDSSRDLFANDNQKVMPVTVKNTGTDTAYNLKIMAQPQYPLTTDGSVRYISSIAPGQSATVDLVFNVDKDGTTGKYGLDLLVNFEDVNGKQLHDTAKIAITVSPKGLLRAIFIDYWFLWLVAVIIFVVVRRKKMQSAKAASAAKK